MLNLKRIGRNLICVLLERQVVALRKRHHFFVVAVTGSVGKTSTKLAIAQVLTSDKRIQYQQGNYNDRLTVPLVVFGQSEPASLYDVFAWLKIFLRNCRMIVGDYSYDGVVLELGSDGPGQVEEFAYLQPELSVVTAVAPEHMEYFGTLEAVAEEELSVAHFSQKTLLNGDDIAPSYRPAVKEYETYGLESKNTYFATYHQADTLDGERVSFHVPGMQVINCKLAYMGAPGVKVALCALAVAHTMGVPIDKARVAVEQLRPFAGRMQLLPGKRGSVLIDDTYNASPLAVKAALDLLYAVQAPTKIAILGSMNELGETTREAHEAIGRYCDPTKISTVVTLGTEANEYLAPAARHAGCNVVEFTNPYHAGKWIENQLAKGVVVLAKGSQNGVFAEEALKALLAHTEDQKKLVRQSANWLRIKRGQFPSSK